MTKLLFDATGSCIGALSEDGSAHLADVVILAAGARIGELIDVKNEIVAKAMGVATIQLTAEEAKRYQTIPMFDHFEQGKFHYALLRQEILLTGIGMIFPPNKTGLLKLCSCRYVTNYSNSPVPGVSVGRSYVDWPTDQIPIQIGSELRVFLRDVIPELADRPWEWTRMCWLVSISPYNKMLLNHAGHKGMRIARTRTSAYVLTPSARTSLLPPRDPYTASSFYQQLENMSQIWWKASWIRNSRTNGGGDTAKSLRRPISSVIRIPREI